MTRESLREAIAQVVNATLRARHPGIWGEGTTACAADSKQFGAWDQNLMTEWHIRYGGRGVMIYWHVERHSTCIYSQLKTPSSSEVASMIEGVVHGHQQLSLFNAHYDERCFLPIHIYDAESGHCLAVILRPGKTPAGKEIRSHLRRLVRRIRLHWPHTRITIRGDSHYGRPEVMDWCDDNGVRFILGLAGNDVLAAQVETTADAVRTRRAIGNLAAVRDYAETRYGAKSWSTRRRVAARSMTASTAPVARPRT